MTGPIVGTEWMVGALADRPPAGQEVRLYIDAATGNATYSDGGAWHSFGGGSGGSVADATTTTPGVVLADVAPSGAHPVALTTDGLPGITGDGLTPGGLNVAGGQNVTGITHAAAFAAADTSQISSFDGGISAAGQGAEISADFGNVPFEARFTDGGGLVRLAFRVDSDGTVIAFHPFRLHAQFQTNQAVAHTLGAYSGNAIPVYAEDGTTLLGYWPLYA